MRLALGPPRDRLPRWWNADLHRSGCAPAAASRLASAEEVTVEANPETVTPRLAALLREEGVTRVSLGAQSQPRLLSVYSGNREARTTSDARSTLSVMPALTTSRSISSTDPRPERLRSGRRHRRGARARAGAPVLLRAGSQAGNAVRTRTETSSLARRRRWRYFAQVVERLTGAGFRWYETANFCRDGGRDLRSRHNLAYWLGRDYVGIGVGAVSTVAGRRWRNTPRLPAYLEALEGRSSPLREVELDADVRESG